MAVVKINAVTVPDGRGPELERRFSDRLDGLDAVEGFLGFELLRPNDGTGRYLVYSRWATEEAFEAWRTSDEFRAAHQRVPGREPVGTHNELLSFDIVPLPGTPGEAAA
ncbi:MAG: antibiotic biosynthesis monooxygenase [Actinobacteria bacterium]|nr:antibiotic biosynthesis monooxygenase [Actinomycetota bacterium]